MKAKIDGITLHYELVGQGKTLSLIHGMGNGLSLWTKVMPSLASHHRVLSYDVRGHGESDKPPGPYSRIMFAQDHRDLLNCLGIEKTSVLGFSMGGVIALQFALMCPEMIEALIIVGSSSQINAKASALYEERAMQVETRGMEAASDIVDTVFAPDFARQNPGEVAGYRQMLMRNDQAAYAAAARAMTRYDLTEELGKLGCPTLVIVGDQDASVGVGGSVIIHRHVRGSRLTIVPGIGHMIMLERPEVLVNEVLRFMSGL